MKKKRISAFLITVALILSSVSTIFAQTDTVDNEKTVQLYSNNALKSILRTYSHHIADNFYYGIDDDELLFSALCRTIDDGEFTIDGAVEAMIEALEDEHSDFFTKEEYALMTEDITGKFAGIGVTITQKDKGIEVIGLIDASPALRAGIKVGDYIIGVNGILTEGMSVTEVRNLVVGEIGTTVKITLLRKNQTMEVECTRESIEVQHTETRMVTDDIAYLRLEQFSKNSPEEIKGYLSEIQSNSVKKLIIDIRNNPGGDLEAALEIARIFISTGNLAEVRYKNEENNTFLRSENFNTPRLKIALLVNENSASASEFLATAFKYRRAGKVIGTTTYGKGSMQVLMQLPTGAGMKYTIGEFYSPDGKRVHTVGVTPDIIVENKYEKVDETTFEPINLDEVNLGGQNGVMTLALEQRLEVLGAFFDEPDEIFDEKTKEAVIKLQNALGYEATGIPGFYEYLYLKDLSYDFEVADDLQLQAAIEYLYR